MFTSVYVMSVDVYFCVHDELLMFTFVYVMSVVYFYVRDEC